MLTEPLLNLFLFKIINSFLDIVNLVLHIYLNLSTFSFRLRLFFNPKPIKRVFLQSLSSVFGYCRLFKGGGGSWIWFSESANSWCRNPVAAVQKENKAKKILTTTRRQSKGTTRRSHNKEKSSTSVLDLFFAVPTNFALKIVPNSLKTIQITISLFFHFM